MGSEIKRLDLFYTVDKKNMVDVNVVLLTDELKVMFPDKSKSYKIRDLLLNNLNPWEDWASIITCNTKDGSTFFLIGGKERITSLFLNITNLRWRKKIVSSIPG